MSDDVELLRADAELVALEAELAAVEAEVADHLAAGRDELARRTAGTRVQPLIVAAGEARRHLDALRHPVFVREPIPVRFSYGGSRPLP